MQTSNSTPYGYIYKITNPINGKCYIGQTTNLPEYRWKKYKRLECKGQFKIYNALKKYGPNIFTYTSLDTAANQEELDFLEETYILCFDSRESGYNIKEGGSNGKHSSETKQKISKALKGHKQSEAHRIKNIKGHIGIKLSEEAKQKLSIAFKGNKYSLGYRHSKETKEKMKQSHIGIKMSETSRINNSKAHLGHVVTEETRKKLSLSHKGVSKWSEEQRKQMSILRTGKIQTEETKRKRAESITKWWAQRKLIP